MNSRATIVLPIHNGERTLRATVDAVLSLAMGPGGGFQLVIVDDGSTDETYETACELAVRYPQVHVLRQPFQRGLGAALERVRRSLGVSEVIAHDGASAIDLEELATILRSEAAPTRREAGESRGSRRFAAVTSLNARLQAAHRTVLGFRRLALEPGVEPRRRHAPAPLSLGANLLAAFTGSPATNP